ncbi:MAG: RNA polymerase sigma factor [Methylococcaceae bacterium]|nr:RNA polymerase sigma factor [Methylococcaceae bacterium]
MPPTFQEHILQDHQDELLRFIFRKVNCPDTAQDIFQDTYVRYTNYPGKSQIKNHRAFIFRIAANLVADYERKSRVRKRFTGVEELEIDTFPQADNFQPEQLLSVQERLELMARTVEGLPPRCREVFILRRVEGLSHAQIAKCLEISPRMVEKHLHKALVALQNVLDTFD